MKKVEINLQKELEKILPQVLKKDLQYNEIICTTCNGLGLTTHSNIYGIQGDRDPEVIGKSFPYGHQSLGFCPDCFNGVQRTCVYCGKVVQKGYINKCDCDGYKKEEDDKRIVKWNETLSNAKEVNEKDVDTMLYCEELGKFYANVDEFLESEDNWMYDDDITRLWVAYAISLDIDASNVLENATQDLHEDCYDNLNIGELQSLLDVYVKKYKSSTATYYPDYKEYVVIDYNNK